MSERRGLSREQIAKRVAAELEDGWLVNLGLGIPTLAVNYIPEGRDILFHSENGIIGMGPRPADEDVDTDLMSAGKGPITLIEGAALVHHADSFVVARGGRLDAAILGAYQVADNGDFANWRLPDRHVGGIGGAMDIAVGAQRVFITMSQTDKDGTPKLVEDLTYPLTTKGCVTKVFTEMAVIAVTDQGFVLEEVAPGFTPDDIVARTAASLIVPDDVGTIAA
ncbi:MAG: 3-oxoacid CoA-transferase subunit B [Rhodospirillaceae bacterium]|nr:3-oxoacid CoA-transferase subunit B [Rhodospirillaceae bacterium]MDD9915632.1 3-oxoacid CoA-transferase subunit B [Rhodospirillaceae bacterium]MDD9924527.1 3-oxoacid CoA-transferase subunit B [Rhodospirillaceae bacterium]